MADFHETEQFYHERGFSRRIGFGRHPALLVVDVTRAFTDPTSSVGANLDTMVAAIQRLLEVARAKNIPIIFTAVAYDESNWQAARFFLAKVPSLKELQSGTPMADLDPRLGRQPSETLIVKQFASAFFGTSLASLLTAQGCDTLIVTGCTTSGCVRASVLDTLQYGFRPIVPIEAVGDRAIEPHRANLFDMQAKYADVISLSETLEYLLTLPASSREQ